MTLDLGFSNIYDLRTRQQRADMNWAGLGLVTTCALLTRPL